MYITRQPANAGIYFQKNIPEIIAQKSTADLFVNFTLSIDGALVLAEKYVYDSNNQIEIKYLHDVIEKYFTSTKLILSCSFTLTEGSDNQTATFSVIKCDADFTDVVASTWTATHFLTRMKNDKRTAINQNEFLSFLKKPSYGAISVHAEVNYIDAAGELQQTEAVIETIAAGGVLSVGTFNSSISKVRSLAGTGKIIHYAIWLTGTGFITSKYNYLPDYSPYRFKTNFVFENCFGCLETFTATGSLDVKKSAEYTLNNISNKYRKISQEFKMEKSISSGFLNGDEMDWLDDLLNSFSVGITTPGTGITEEITLTTVDKTDTRANVLQAFDFSYQMAAVNHNQFFNRTNGIFDYTFDYTFN